MESLKKSLVTYCLLGCFALVGCQQVFLKTTHYDARTIVMTDSLYPMVVIGGGIGGLTAAIYTAQANIPTLVLQGSMPGGLLTQSSSIRNWPGEQDIDGHSLMSKVEQHAAAASATLRHEEVVDTDFSSWPYSLTIKPVGASGASRKIQALSCIIAIGAKNRYLGVPGEKKYWGQGVSNCSVCDGSLYKNKDVVVIGGGNSAITHATYLANLARLVTIVVRGKALRVRGAHVDELLARNNVKVMFNTTVEEIEGNEKGVTGLRLFDVQQETKKALPTDGVILAIGFDPDTAVFRKQLKCTSAGYLIVNRNQQTIKAGIFAIGDIVDPETKQAVSAAGDAAKAALKAQEFLRDIHFTPQKRVNTSSVHKPVLSSTVNDEHDDRRDIQGGVREIVSDKDFQTLVLESKKPVIVDFYAIWCGPCKMLAPHLESLAKDQQKDLAIVKVNVDKFTHLAQRYGVKGMPTLVVFSDGKVIDSLVGYRDYEQLKKDVAHIINK